MVEWWTDNPSVRQARRGMATREIGRRRLNVSIAFRAGFRRQQPRFTSQSPPSNSAARTGPPCATSSFAQAASKTRYQAKRCPGTMSLRCILAQMETWQISMVCTLAGWFWAGVEATPALHFTLADITTHIGESVAQGNPIRDALRSAGLNEDLASSLKYTRNSSESLTNALRLTIGSGGGITGIPTTECLHKYLPPDRDPTEDEGLEPSSAINSALSPGRSHPDLTWACSKEILFRDR